MFVKNLHIKECGFYILHNTPFYFIEIFPKNVSNPIHTKKVFLSLYELKKSAADWDICDHGVTKSPDCKT